MGFISMLNTARKVKKNLDKAKETKENPKGVIGEIILRKISPYLLILFFILLFLLIIGACLGALTTKEEEYNKENKGEEITLTIGENGLFKTSAQKNVSTERYELYAVLDEAKFKEYINSNNYSELFSKDAVIPEMEEDKNTNVSNSDQENLEDNEEYLFLKEMIIKLTASSYPEDVKFVLNKTLKFEDNEDPTDQVLINEKIKKIKDNLTTKTISGGISIYRNDKSKKLKYIENRDKLDDAYYTLEGDKIVVSYQEAQTVDISTKEKIDFKEFDYQKIISPYIMPIDFIEQLYEFVPSEQFLYYVSKIVSSSNIDLIIFDNTTVSTLNMQEKYEKIIYTDEGQKEKSKIEEPKHTEIHEGKNLKMYVLNVDNWVALIHNKYQLTIEPEKVIYDNYDNGYKREHYEKLLEKMEEQGAAGLKNEILNRINKFSTKTQKEQVKISDPNTGEEIEATRKVQIRLIEQKYKLTQQNRIYTMQKDKASVWDNTDYFCGLIKNSVNNEKFGNEYNATQLYDPGSPYKYSLNDINNIEEAQGIIENVKAWTGDVIEGIKNSFSKSKSSEKFSILQKMFPEYDEQGNAICYIKTGTNMLVCPYTALEGKKDFFLVVSKGRFDETINLIWDKLYNKNINAYKRMENINLKELENEDINDTSTNLKNFIKSHEGTTITVSDGISYHVSYLDSKGIPTTAWGINLFQQFTKFKRYLGDIVYTPAFYMAVEEGKHNETNSFIIPDNIIEIIFNEMVDQKVTAARSVLSGGVSRGYYPTNNEIDAMAMVIWGYGNFGNDYIVTVLEALKQSKRSNSLDRTDRKKLFNYYDYLRNNLKTREGAIYFDEKGIPKIEYLIYTDGIYYRRYGELIGAETQPIKHALEKYEELVDYVYRYDENSLFFNKVAYTDDPGYYALSKNNPDNVPLTINDYEYVTWVLKDLEYLDSVYTNYDSFIKNLVKDETSNDYGKFQVVDNTGENGIEKTVKTYDDLLAGDIVIVQEGSKKSIKIYAGRKNWIEMDSETLEDLKDDGKRENDRFNWCISAPIANYKGEGKTLDALYGKTIDINNILWVFRNEEIANQYIYNDSLQYTDWEIKDFKLTRNSSYNP